MHLLKTFRIEPVGFAGYAILAEEPLLDTVLAAVMDFITNFKIQEHFHGRSWDCARIDNLSFALSAATLTFQKMLFIVQSVEVQWSMNARMHPIQMGILFAAEWKSSAERIAADLRISIADHVVCSQNLVPSTVPGRTTGSLHGQVIGAAP